MTFVEMAQGAAANSRTAEANPLNLLRKLRADDPTGSMARILSKWKEQVITDDEMLAAALVYAGTNYWHRLEADEKQRTSTQRQRQRKKEADAQQAAVLVEKVRAIVLLDLVLPNGKRLGDSTFADCQKAGGWFLKIAKKGKPQQIVGKVLTEKQLQAIQ